MSYTFLRQVILIALAIVMLFTYISPKFKELQAQQDEIAKYKEVVGNAQLLNSSLATLLNKFNSLSQVKLQTLNRFLPDTIDDVAVSQDIETLAVNQRMQLSSLVIVPVEATDTTEPAQIIQYNEDPNLTGDMTTDTMTGSQDAATLLKQLTPHDFKVTVSGSYTDFVAFLEALERNIYPLRVQSLSLEPEMSDAGWTGSYAYTLNVRTYAYTYQQ